MIGKPKSKFHIESSGSEGFSSEEEDNTMIERDKLNLKQKLQSQLAQPPLIANMVNDNHNNTNKHKNTINNNIKNSPAFTNSNPSSKSNSNSTITSMNPDTTK